MFNILGGLFNLIILCILNKTKKEKRKINKIEWQQKKKILD